MSPTLISINTDASLPEIGRIRLGITETVKKKGGGEYERPKNLNHFVVTFNSGYDEAEKAFNEIFEGKEMNEFPVVLPFGTMEQNYNDWFTCFRYKKMVAKIGVNEKIDPLSYHWETHFESAGQGKVRPVVRDWKSIETGKPVPVDMMQNVDEKSGFGIGPIIYSTKKGDEGRDYYAEYAMTLRVMIIPLAMEGFAGYFTMYSKSYRNGREIAGFLKDATEKAKLFGKHSLVGIPMRLFRTTEKSSMPGSTSQKDEFFVKMAYDKNYQKQALLTSQQMATPSIPQLSAGEDIVEGEFKEDISYDDLPSDEWDQDPVEDFEDIPDAVDPKVEELELKHEKEDAKNKDKPGSGEVAQVSFNPKMIKSLIKQKILIDEKEVEETLNHTKALPSSVGVTVAKDWINVFRNCVNDGMSYTEAAVVADKMFTDKVQKPEEK